LKLIPTKCPAAKNDVAAVRQEAFRADRHFSDSFKLCLKLFYQAQALFTIAFCENADFICAIGRISIQNS
jgi:hypothetical protein